MFAVTAAVACADQMGVETSDKRIMLTEAAMNPKANRQKMVETMFEKYGFAGVQVRSLARAATPLDASTARCAADTAHCIRRCPSRRCWFCTHRG